VIDWPTILRDHGPTVWRTVFRLLNHHPDAHDCYQETFLSAWQYASLEPVSDWRSFLVSLAARKAIDRLRQRYRERSRGNSLDAAPELPSTLPSPHEHAAATDLLERVRHCLAAAPDQYAQIFWLSCVEELSHDQISQRLEMTPGAARVLLHRARTYLRAALSTHEPVERSPHERNIIL